MEKENILDAFSKFSKFMDANTISGYYRDTSRTSLLQSGTATRSNTAWKKCEYIIAYIDDNDPARSLGEYLEGWKKITKNYTGQTLFLELEKGEWGMYDSEGSLIGDTSKVESFIKLKQSTSTLSKSIDLDFFDFYKYCNDAGLIFSSLTIYRFLASLGTKPFLICSGLSGSGKTKLAQAFVQWISESENQYKIIPVGPDWTNREPLLGYPNGLDIKNYVLPESGALQLILEATKKENQNKPYFLILDEMNLSHVERYFADFLSVMESKEKLKLYSSLGGKRYSQSGVDNVPGEEYFIPFEIEWPDNLFIIGTVNIDETTYMFSPKVLDRANVIEFRITPEEMRLFFNQNKALDMSVLYLDNVKQNGGAGQSKAKDFLNWATDRTVFSISDNKDEIDLVLNDFFSELQILGSEFGYRSANEIKLLITKLGTQGFINENEEKLSDNLKIDIAIMQKLLPKLHGSRKKLVGPLESLAGFCLKRRENVNEPSDQNKTKTKYQQFIAEKRDTSTIWEIKYSISFEKIERMLKNVIENGFTSYAEA